MLRRQRLALAAPLAPLVALATSVALDGCVGDAPVPAVVPADAGGADADTGTMDAPPQTDTGSEAGTPTCWGQPFPTPTAVSTDAIASDIDLTKQVWGPRIAGGSAYFAATSPAESFPRIFRASWAPASLTSARPLLQTPSSDTASEWSPTFSVDGSLLVLAVGVPALASGPPRRGLAYVTSFGATVTPTAIASLSTDDDDADPWLVGSPPKALYFMRGASTASNPFLIYRSPVTVGAGNPTFGAPTRVTLTCPVGGGDCGTPVVAPAEDHMVFAAWEVGGFEPSIHEARLAVAGSAATASDLVAHPELGVSYPSWISDNGCEIVVSGGTATSIRYARRSPK